MAEEPSLTTEESKPFTLNGREGIWIPKDMANAIFSDINLVPKLERKVNDMDSLLTLRMERIENLKLNLSLAEKAEESAFKSLSEANLRAEKAESKLKVWYRNPLFLISVGIILTVGLEVGSIAVIKSL